MSRPTALTNELISSAQSYFDGEYLQSASFPSLSGLALYLGVSRSTVHLYCQQAKDPQKSTPLHDVFGHICEDILATQEVMLLQNGLEGDWNSAIVKLALGKHGYSDRGQLDVGSNETQKPLKIIFEGVSGDGGDS